jgi:hypothetical protein
MLSCYQIIFICTDKFFFLKLKVSNSFEVEVPLPYWPLLERPDFLVGIGLNFSLGTCHIGGQEYKFNMAATMDSSSTMLS